MTPNGVSFLFFFFLSMLLLICDAEPMSVSCKICQVIQSGRFALTSCRLISVQSAVAI